MTVDKEAIRAQAEHALTLPLRFQHESTPGPRTVIALLDALDEAEARAGRAEKAEHLYRQIAAEYVYSLRQGMGYAKAQRLYNEALGAARGES